MTSRWTFRVCGLLLALLAASAALGQQDEPQKPATSSPEPVRAKPVLTPDAHGALSQEQMQTLLRYVAERDLENQKLKHEYTYTEREVQKTLDGRGQVKSTEINTYEILAIYGEPVQRLVQKDDKALSEKDAAKEDEKIQKIIDKRKNESDNDRQKREEKDAKEREEGRKFVTEIADAYNFKLVGSEAVDGRDAWQIAAEPRAEFVPRSREAHMLPKFHGTLWIDKTDLQLTKMDIEAIDTVSIGWVLARVHKGTRIVLEQTRVNDEVWLPRYVKFKFDARIALFKGYNLDGEQTYRDYKKFRTSAKIVGVGEVKP